MKRKRVRKRERYNPAMVRRLKRLMKGPFIRIPDGDLLKWLEKRNGLFKPSDTSDLKPGTPFRLYTGKKVLEGVFGKRVRSKPRSF